ncbi:hypothetical protein INR49_022323 [Caranx melampygus]|nr:hypothetical protein INR49_022323 [Caranx melampygus]
MAAPIKESILKSITQPLEVQTIQSGALRGLHPELRCLRVSRMSVERRQQLQLQIAVGGSLGGAAVAPGRGHSDIFNAPKESS